MGVYGGELIEDVRRDAVNRLVKVDAIYQYPAQRAIMTDSLHERLPLPFGAIVRMRVIEEDRRPGCRNADEYGDMLEAALNRLMGQPETIADIQVYYILLMRAGRRLTGVSGSYARH